MPLSKKRNRERMRVKRGEKKGINVLSSFKVKEIRKSGFDIEKLFDNGMVPAVEYYRLMRDRDAIKAHLDWHHESVKFPDIVTVVERLQSRVTLLEAEMALRNAQEEKGSGFLDGGID